MNTEQLRHSLKLKWLQYYQEHREWLVKLGVWVSYEGQRRPSSSFIIATLSVLEPRLPQLMPIVVELNSNPDRVVQALGLNISPDDALKRAIAKGELKDLHANESRSDTSTSLKLLPASNSQDSVDLYLDQGRSPRDIVTQDAACSGIGGRDSLPSRLTDHRTNKELTRNTDV